jgi:hypothetical protein
MRIDDGLYASWIGTAMTAFTGAAGFAAYLYPARRELFVIAAIAFAAIALYSFFKAIQVRRNGRLSLEDRFGQGLQLLHHEHIHREVQGREAYLWLFKVRIHAAARSVFFQCRDPLHYATAQMKESPVFRPEVRWRQNWAEAIFDDPDAARGGVLCMELSSVTPLELKEAIIRSAPMD